MIFYVYPERTDSEKSSKNKTSQRWNRWILVFSRNPNRVRGFAPWQWNISLQNDKAKSDKNAWKWMNILKLYEEMKRTEIETIWKYVH